MIRIPTRKSENAIIFDSHFGSKSAIISVSGMVRGVASPHRKSTEESPYVAACAFNVPAALLAAVSASTVSVPLGLRHPSVSVKRDSGTALSACPSAPEPQ